ncbi:MAG: hypothetical protein IPK72_05070 [Candidatus Eisenbacteria bacterium]|nr:hypothetical protein [Candidatus Eisenbacteria bacterium]
MSALPFLIAALLLPWIGRFARRTFGSRHPLGPLLHLVAVSAWAGWARWVSLPLQGAAADPMARFVVLLGAGFLYTELVFLLPRGRSAAPSDAPPAIESEPPLLDGEPLEDAEGEELPIEAQALLQRILQCESRKVDEVMTPRAAIHSAPGGATVEATLQAMRRAGHNRVIAIEGSLDRVLGVAHAKDLVPLLADGRGDDPIRLHLRRWLRVPSGHTLTALLEDFRRNRVHLGLVGDAVGRTLGLITLQDISTYLAGTSAPEGGEYGGEGR